MDDHTTAHDRADTEFEDAAADAAGDRLAPEGGSGLDDQEADSTEEDETVESSTGSSLGGGNLGDGAVDGIGDDGAADDGLPTAMGGPTG